MVSKISQQAQGNEEESLMLFNLSVAWYPKEEAHFRLKTTFLILSGLQ